MKGVDTMKEACEEREGRRVLDDWTRKIVPGSGPQRRTPLDGQFGLLARDGEEESELRVLPGFPLGTIRL
jgi:hypothetical protein